jgi:3-oxoacyl-[acyl-carrier protein] reductase
MLGAIRVARTVVAHLDTGGAIGLVLSTSVKQPVGGIEISSGLRPGLAMWAKHLADELGPKGIRVFSLMPGRILTDRMTSLMPNAADRDRLAQTIPMRRMGDPEEFGRVAAFLLSPAASYLTGLTVPIDGGALRSL